jgi:hypothetical protein
MTASRVDPQPTRVSLLRFIAIFSNANQGRSSEDFSIPARPDGVSEARWLAMCRFFWNHLGQDEETLRVLGLAPGSRRL